MSCCDFRLQKELGLKSNSSIPIPTRTIVGKQIIPIMPPITPDTLTHGGKSSGCNGFFNITTAYGKNAANCDQQYSVRECPDNRLRENYSSCTKSCGDCRPQISALATIQDQVSSGDLTGDAATANLNGYYNALQACRKNVKICLDNCKGPDAERARCLSNCGNCLGEASQVEQIKRQINSGDLKGDAATANLNGFTNALNQCKQRVANCQKNCS